MTQRDRPGADTHKPSDFNGFKVLWFTFIGAGIGVVLSIFLDTFIRNTPATIRHTRLHYLYGVVISSTLSSVPRLRACVSCRRVRPKRSTARASQCQGGLVNRRITSLPGWMR